MDPGVVFGGMRAFTRVVPWATKRWNPSSGIKLAVSPPRSPVACYFIPGVSSIDELSGPYISNLEFPDQSWIRKNRAYPLGRTVFTVTVQAAADASAILQRVELKATKLALTRGVSLVRPIGGPVEALSLRINLDDETIVCIDSRDLASSRELPIDFNITDQSPLNLRVEAVANADAIEWQLIFCFLINGREVFRKCPADPVVTIPREYSGIDNRYIGYSDHWESE